MNDPGSANVVHAQSILTVLGFQVVLMSLCEAYRMAGDSPLSEGGLDVLYRGKAFDPHGLADVPDTFAELRVRRSRSTD